MFTVTQKVLKHKKVKLMSRWQVRNQKRSSYINDNAQLMHERNLPETMQMKEMREVEIEVEYPYVHV